MINIAFYVDQFASADHFVLLHRAIQSARAQMPSAHVIHLTTLDAPIVEAADERIAIAPEGAFGYRRGSASSLVRGDTLFLDCDTVIQRDVSHVFDGGFDIALAEIEREGYPDMKFNGGVVFSRCPRFWTDFAQRAREFDFKNPKKDWFPIERAFGETVASGSYRVQRLAAALYNRTPLTEDEDVGGVFVVHYKGMRKKWMVPPRRETPRPARGHGLLAQLLLDIFRKR